MRWKLLLACTGLAMAGMSQASDLKIKADPVFTGAQINGIVPISVTVQNDGADARGSLEVSCGNFGMAYPIDLPRGAMKKLTVYPRATLGEDVFLLLSTNRGDEKAVFRQMIPPEFGSMSVLMIGDGAGSLAFLRSQAGGSGVHVLDVYVTPENAPDRSVAYRSFATVVLGPGAERLSDGSVDGLHNYITAGGTVLFLGGASAPLLGDRRWSDVVPVRAGLPKVISNSSLLSALSGQAGIGQPYTITTASPVPGAVSRNQNGDLMFAFRDVGLGRAFFYAFDPLDQPLTRWAGRKEIFLRTLRMSESLRSVAYLASFSSHSEPEGGYYGSYGGVTRTPYTSYSSGYGGVSGVAGDPFSTKLPQASKVFWILATYFIIIIPVNFILLKRLKRGELAWFTAPVISMAFAGVFFASAKELYSAQLSRATQGLIVATDGGRSDLFVGKSQIFFPSGGSYDLKMSGLEAVGPSQEQYGYDLGDTNQYEGLNPIDVGEIRIPNMQVGNLTFRELSFRQVLPSGKWFQVQMSGQGAKRKISVRNTSGYVITGTSVVVNGRQIPLASSLQPGQIAAVPMPATLDRGPANRDPQDYTQNLTSITAQTKEVVIKGLVTDPQVGPQVGKVVEGRQQVNIAFFTGIHVAKEEL